MHTSVTGQPGGGLRNLHTFALFMKFRVVTVAFAIITPLLARPLPAQSQSTASSATITPRLDSLFASINSNSTPGCAVGVSQANGAPVYRSYGLANLEHLVPIQLKGSIYLNQSLH